MVSACDTNTDQFTRLQLSLQSFCLPVNLWCKLHFKERATTNHKITNKTRRRKNREERVQQSCFPRSLMLWLTWFPDVAYPNFNRKMKMWMCCESNKCVYKPLFDAQVCIDRGIACCASQVLVFSVGDVLSCSVVSVLLCQAEVNKEQLTERKKTHGGYLLRIKNPEVHQKWRFTK